VREDLDYLLGLSERDLDLLISEHLVEHDLGSRDDDDEERIFIARRWFSSLSAGLRGALCGHPAIERALQSSGESDRLLAAAIVDVLLTLSFKVDVPVTVLAAKVTHAGIRRICSSDE